MEIKDSVQVLCSPEEGISREMVSVDWDDSYNMKSHPTFHQLIDGLWLERSKKSVKLFNKSKFRFHKVDVERRDDGIPHVKFYLGTTDYKIFIGTNCAPFAEALVNDGLKDYSDSQSYLADPVGVGGILETDDRDLVFMRRSNICAEMPGLIDRPGGHPEPDEVKSNDGRMNDKSLLAVDEIFDSVLKEIRDEINIPIKNLSSPLLLGISFNPNTWRRPSLEFYVRCHLSTKDVLDLYSQQTQAESEESTNLVIIPVSKVLEWNKFQKCDMFNELTHAAKSAIYCLQPFLPK